jgi:hypothetical protein
VKRSKVWYHAGYGIASPVEIAGADPKTFRVLGDMEPRTFYALDQFRVYYCGKVMPGANPATFRRLRNTWSADASQVYYQGYVISKDATGFRMMDEFVGKDRQRVYWSGHVISHEAPHCRYVGHSGAVAYHKDRSRVFANGQAIPGADPASFRVLSHAYSRDARSVFQLTKKVAGAQAKSFQVLTRFYSRDASQVFWDGKLIPGANPETFVILSVDSHCSHDGRRTYHWNNVIRGVDPATFPKGKKCRSCWSDKILFED